ncbi:MAG: MFS transporter [Deltaproteobacteria bacterium]|nr:MFS transporter [Deltaproteobacteria bacterium]
MEYRYTEPQNRWYVLSLGALTMALCMAVPFISLPVLFNEISEDLDLNLVQVGWIWGFSVASGIFIVFLSGILADRFGPKRILIFACSIAGLAGASRGLANSFSSLLLSAFLLGLTTGLIPSCIFKVAATWFPSHLLGFASGILTTGNGVGFTIGSMFSATLLSPMLGGWRNVLFLYGAVSVFVAVIWFITIKDQQSPCMTAGKDRISLREAVIYVIHNRNIWLISLAMLGYIGCTEGMSGYLPLYLREFKGWPPVSADGTLATFTGISTLGAIPLALLSDRLGKRKILILYINVAAIVGLSLLSIAEGLFIWILIIMVGIGRDALVALSLTSAIESRGIGAQYSGTAIGLIQTVLRIGIFIAPPIGNSMAVIYPGLPFVVWAVFGVFSLVCFYLIREEGTYMKI